MIINKIPLDITYFLNWNLPTTMIPLKLTSHLFLNTSYLSRLDINQFPFHNNYIRFVLICFVSEKTWRLINLRLLLSCWQKYFNLPRVLSIIYKSLYHCQLRWKARYGSNTTNEIEEWDSSIKIKSSCRGLWEMYATLLVGQILTNISSCMLGLLLLRSPMLGRNGRPVVLPSF